MYFYTLFEVSSIENYNYYDFKEAWFKIVFSYNLSELSNFQMLIYNYC